MGLARDLSHLPTPARPSDEGCPPDAEPRFAHLLAERWAEQDREEGDRPRARKGARFRHSDAGGCSRALAYAALDVPASNPMDLSGTFTVRLGTMVHDAWQRVIEDLFPGAEVEMKVGSGERAGHIDAVVTIPEGGEPIEDLTIIADGETTLIPASTPDKVIAIEGKTVGGFAYKLAVGERGAPQGPKHAHIVQAALNASEVSADEAVVVYWSKDSISVQAAERKRIGELARFCAEWTFTREQYEPIAQQELERIDAILALVDEGSLPGRRYPDPALPQRHVIVDPKTGRWEERNGDTLVDTGTWWACGYCRWQGTCAQTPAGRAPIDVLVEIGALPSLEVVR